MDEDQVSAGGGIEIGIDATPAEAGRDRVVKSLNDIKAAAQDVGASGQAAGDQLAGGLDQAGASADGAARSMDEIRTKAQAAGDQGATAGDKLSQSWQQVAGTATSASTKVAAATAQLDIASTRLAASQTSLELAYLKVADAADKSTEAQLNAAKALLTAQAGVATSTEAVARAEKSLADAQAGTGRGYVNSQIASLEAEHAVRAFTDSLNAGQDPVRAMALELPRLAQAATFAGGSLGSVGAFLSSGWGIALVVGVSLLTPLIEKLFDTSDAAEAAKKALQDFTKYESDAGNFIDQMTGKLAQQNVVLAQNAALMAKKAGDQDAQRAVSLGQQAFDVANKAASQTVVTSTTAGTSMTVTDPMVQKALDDSNGSAAQLAQNLTALGPKYKDVADQVMNLAAQSAFADKQMHDQRSTFYELQTVLNGGTVATQQSVAAQIQLATANDASAKAAQRLAVAQANLNKLISQPYSADREKQITSATQQVIAAQQAVDAIASAPRATKPKSTDALDNFGVAAGNKISNVLEQFNGEPDLIDKIDAKVRDLDTLIQQLGKRKPPDFQELITEAQEAEVTVRDGLIAQVAKAFEQPKTLADKAAVAIRQLDAEIAVLSQQKPMDFQKSIAAAQGAEAEISAALRKPYLDQIQAMDNDMAVQEQLLQGHGLEADALKQKIAYEKQYGAMLPQDYQQLLAHVAAQHEITNALADQQRIAQMYVSTVHDIQTSFEKFLNEALTNPFKATLDFAKNLIGNLKDLLIKQVSESIFGGLDHQIEDMVTGRSGVQAANKVLVDTTTKTSTATGDLAKAMVDAAQLISDAASRSASTLSGVPVLQDQDGVALTSARGGPETLTEGDVDDVIVTGTKPKSNVSSASTQNLFEQTVSKVVGRLGTGLEKLWNSMPKGLQGVLKTVGSTVNDGLRKIGITLPKSLDSISTTINKGLQGAGTGMFASSIVGALGLKQNSTGAAIGGGLGGIVAGPIGSIVGGILGGTIGSLFSKPKYGTASFTTDSLGNVVGQAGDSHGAGLSTAAVGEAGSVTSGLQQIAQELGGQLTGVPNLAIGTFNGKYRVNDYATNESLNANNFVMGGSLHDFGSDEQSAVNYAIQLAVKQGVISGLSEATENVLKTSSNTDAAVSAAATYEQLFHQAQDLADPIGASFDDIKRGMDSTLATLKSVGYTSQDIADIQAVYTKQQQDALKQLTSGYQSLLDDITTGQDSGLTTSEQLAAAQTKLQTVQAGLATGQYSQDDFTSAGQSVIQLARQTYGSATPEFEAIKNSLVSATQDAINQVNAASDSSGITSTIQATADAAAAQRDQTNAYLASIAGSLAGDNPSGYYDVNGVLQNQVLNKVGNY